MSHTNFLQLQLLSHLRLSHLLIYSEPKFLSCNATSDRQFTPAVRAVGNFCPTQRSGRGATYACLLPADGPSLPRYGCGFHRDVTPGSELLRQRLPSRCDHGSLGAREEFAKQLLRAVRSRPRSRQRPFTSCFRNSPVPIRPRSSSQLTAFVISDLNSPI